MANAVWPAGLPQDFMRDGLAHEFPDMVDRKKMDEGPPMTRPLSTHAGEPWTLPMEFSTAQINGIFRPFYFDTLAGGALPFDKLHPQIEEMESFLFTGPPKLIRRVGRFWWYSLPLITLP